MNAVRQQEARKAKEERRTTRVVHVQQEGGKQTKTDREKENKTMTPDPKEKTQTKEQTKEYTREQERLFSEMTDRAMKNYELAVRTGLKLQEEASQMCANLLSQTATSQNYQKQMANLSSVANSVMPAAQRRMEEVLDL